MLRALTLALAAAGPAAAQEAPGSVDRVRVDLELVLLADASGSIDDDEIALQRRGYADAMVDPQVLFAIDNGGAEGRIAVTYVEWAGSQDVVVDWMVIEDAASAARFGERLLAAPRRAFGSNAIGAALITGLELIETNGYDGWRRVIDFSGDSTWNPAPPRPRSRARATPCSAPASSSTNGLAILCPAPCSGRPRGGDLEAEYRDQIIGGPGAFVVTADSDARFADAVRRKLILEIADLGR